VNNKEQTSQTADLTRRQWILSLGELVALAGVSGALPEFAPAFLQGQGTDVSALPPGLYEASQDHLVHALRSSGKNWSPPQGSETEYAAPAENPFAPQFFATEEFKVVTRMIEILLGNVDAAATAETAQWLDRWLHSAAGVRNAALHLDPLHRILAVAYYGEDSVRDLENSHPDNIARVGLRALQEFASERYARDFMQLNEAEQIDLLRATGNLQPGTDAHKFFDLTRNEAIRGYYTSAKGLEELDYKGNAYYTDSPGCEEKS
jgi:gluconate 2-dehydrogenase subunit 3-like protein